MFSNPFSTEDIVAVYFRVSGGEQDLFIDRQITEYHRWPSEKYLSVGSVIEAEWNG